MSDVERAGVELYADTSEFEQGMDSASSQMAGMGDIAGVANLALDALGAGFDVVSSIIGGAFDLAISGATAGLDFLVSGIQGGIESAIEAEQQINSLNRVINNLGDDAPITSQQALALADNFAVLAGGSDDAVLSIIDLGLKSQQISEQEFPGFIQASLDLGAVIGDNTRAAKLLAMAQDDPLAAYKQIERATGSYNTAIEEQIKAMMASGDTAGALELVMGELATTTGGAALQNTQTLAGTIELFTNTIGEAWEEIGTAFLPTLHTLADVVTTTILPAITLFAGAISEVFTGLLAGESIVSALTPLTQTISMVFGQGAAEQAFGFVLALQGVVDFVTLNIPLIQETFGTVFTAISTIVTEVSTVFTTALLPALQTAFTEIFGQGPTAQEVLTGLLNALSTGAQTAATWVSTVLVPAVQSFSVWIVEDFAPAAASVVDWLQVNVPIAIQTAADFWNNTLQPALALVWDFIVNSVIPAISDVVTWLQINIPPAVQVVADFWNNVLNPALNAVWTFITTSVIPTFTTMVEWLQVTIPAAVQVVSDYWTNTLEPALDTVWAFITDNVIPVFTSLQTVFTELTRIVSEVFVLAWNTVLLPALTALHTYIQDNLNPILNGIGLLFTNTLTPAFNDFTTGVIESMTSAFGSLQDALRSVKDWLDSVAEALANIHIPGDLTPGSPTPFEIGMRGIASALSLVNDEMGTLDALNNAMKPIELLTGVNGTVSSAERVGLPPALSSSGTIYNNNVTQYVNNAGYVPAQDMYATLRQGLNAAMA